MIVDEVQFASREQIEFLSVIADVADVPVFAYGLKNNYKGELFAGSKRMIELADNMEESQTICWCGMAAKFTAIVNEDDGSIVREGLDEETLNRSGTYSHVSLCRKHYMNGQSGIGRSEIKH